MKPEETVDYFLKIVWQSVANKYNQLASEYGLTQASGYMLINIHEDGIAVSQIASLLGVKSTSLSRTLRSMEELKLIYRKVDPMDKRSVKIFLTELGNAKRKIAKNVVKEFNEYLNAHLEAGERLQLILTLNKINKYTQEYSTETVNS